MAVKYSTVVGRIEINVLDRYESNISKGFYFEIEKKKKSIVFIYSSVLQNYIKIFVVNVPVICMNMSREYIAL